MKISGFKIILAAMIQILLLTGLGLDAQDLKDVDGNIYTTAKLGPQVWLAANLKVTHFRNGDAIPEAKTAEEWAAAAKDGKPAWCYYENDTANLEKYGLLYNWHAINDQRGLAPEGWHVPVNSDWQTLVKNLIGIDVAGGKLKSTEGWKRSPGTDKIRFNALPGGCRDADGKFRDIGVIGQWWSNSVPVSVKPSDKIYSFWLSDNLATVRYYDVDKGAGLSVRCEKD
jgi:uncharacterized protein (TIGR02145 family)